MLSRIMLTSVASGAENRLTALDRRAFAITLNITRSSGISCTSASLLKSRTLMEVYCTRFLCTEERNPCRHWHCKHSVYRTCSTTGKCLCCDQSVKIAQLKNHTTALHRNRFEAVIYLSASKLQQCLAQQ